MTPSMKLVRGTDHRAGPDGSPEQQALLDELRAEGLGEAEIDFWRLHELTVGAVLGYAGSKGCEVNVLIWSGSKLFSHSDPRVVQEQLTRVGVTCILDDSAFGLIHHPIESLHQKIAVVDGAHAYVGGIDPLIEPGGDFDRWDYPSHHYYEEESSLHPWHDAHGIIEGPAVGDVELNFRQRWNDVVQRHHLDSRLLVGEHPLPPHIASNSLVQVARTIPRHTYSFAPEEGIQGIAQLYMHAVSNAQQFVDDLWSTAGSANLNNRGMRDDTEMNVAVLNAELARGLRLLLWAEHLGLENENDLLVLARHLNHQREGMSVDERAASLFHRMQERLGNPLLGLRLMVEHAQHNLQRYKARQPLVGHLLPYLTAGEAKREGLHFREAHGWVEAPE
jgi:hypothetical protein